MKDVMTILKDKDYSGSSLDEWYSMVKKDVISKTETQTVRRQEAGDGQGGQAGPAGEDTLQGDDKRHKEEYVGLAHRHQAPNKMDFAEPVLTSDRYGAGNWAKQGILLTFYSFGIYIIS